MDESYCISIRPPTPPEVAQVQCAQFLTPAEKVVTRGKGAGGPASQLCTAELEKLWQARLNMNAPRMRQLPDIVQGVPEALRRTGIAPDDAGLCANAPRIYPAPVPGPRTDHPGQLTCTDIWTAPAPSKFGGFKYAVAFVDMYDKGDNIDFMRTKDQHPDRLERYFIVNDGRHGCVFKGGTVYADNERVLNSSRVRALCDVRGVSLRNSCEYEPWQNGAAESVFRTLPADQRTMHVRGGAGPEYWPFSMSEASYIRYRTRILDNGRTGYEVRRGWQPDLSNLRPMFCLAYVRVPRAFD